MQTFKDSETGEFYQFDDDVVADDSSGYYVFRSAYGLVEAPATLVRASMDDMPTPPLPVPESVSRYQGRQALRLSTVDGGQLVLNDASEGGTGRRDLLETVEELLARAETPAYYRDAWADIQQFERDSPMLEAIADELGLGAAQLDDLFRFAATLKA
ncbi:hypothetical protein [Achromobacter xylosoxidans]|uniref:hypothetical protein n=1 Tax=Alcaligenes xylosoxydans xylosoxydans TaxID=85698 RepID=UPI0008A10864|nr:hypothetical protein [Achromobacter xylosoxidans]OFQ51960.1 hypothetical protein HMPREF2939_08565 [Achromobacter xylosoxidans]